VANDLRFSKEPGERDFSDLHIQLALMPARWLQFELYHRFDPETLTAREVAAALTLLDGDRWSASLYADTLQREISQYELNTRYRLNEVWELFAALRYDAREERFNEQRYGVYQNLHNQWLLRYSLAFREGSRREASWAFSLSVDLLRF
jgi:LPS-assembly protein